MRKILVICLFSSVIFTLAEQAKAFCLIERQGPRWGILFEPQRPIKATPEKIVSSVPLKAWTHWDLFFSSMEPITIPATEKKFQMRLHT